MRDVAWSPDGARIATASGDRTVRVREVVTDGAALVERPRSRVFRRLTRDERHALVIPAPGPRRRGAVTGLSDDRSRRQGVRPGARANR